MSGTNEETKMKPEVKSNWVEALESGDYEQTDGGLCKLDEAGGKFCCLGVLSELAVKSGENVIKDDGDFGHYVLYDGEEEFLPQSVAMWAGLDDDNPRVDREVAREEIQAAFEAGDIGDKKLDALLKITREAILDSVSLAVLNDRGLPFKSISNIIKRCL